MRECKTQNEIRERLKRNAGIITESKNESHTKIFDIEDLTYEDLLRLVHQSVKEYFEDTFDTSPDIEDMDMEEDVELAKIIKELELELDI